MTEYGRIQSAYAALNDKGTGGRKGVQRAARARRRGRLARALVRRPVTQRHTPLLWSLACAATGSSSRIPRTSPRRADPDRGTSRSPSPTTTRSPVASVCISCAALRKLPALPRTARTGEYERTAVCAERTLLRTKTASYGLLLRSSPTSSSTTLLHALAPALM